LDQSSSGSGGSTGAGHEAGLAAAVVRAGTPSAAPSVPPHVAGDLIGGKYRLCSLLGEGGMGSVWLARNTVLDVDVAIKLIRHGVASREASERLLQEARAAARLEHPSILRIFDFGYTDEGDPFIAMELLRGESLAHLLDRRGRLSAPNAVRTLLPVASAMCAAHAKGIVHRDLKPENIVLTENDSGSIVPKVVDFGIAKVRAEGVANRRLTVAGTIMGSPDYMCPEQARGRSDVDEKCDVWSLSIILYECLVGQRPFDGDNYNALLNAIIEATPTPITDFAAGDDALWAIIQLGLTKDPEARPTMRELGEHLAQWAYESGADSDVSGVLLTHWLGLPSRRPPVAKGGTPKSSVASGRTPKSPVLPPPGGPVAAASLLPPEPAPQPSLIDIEVGPGLVPATAPSSETMRHLDWSASLPSSRRALGLAAVPLLLLGVAAGTAWVSLRSSQGRGPSPASVRVEERPQSAPAKTAGAGDTPAVAGGTPATPVKAGDTPAAPPNAGPSPAATANAGDTPVTPVRDGSSVGARGTPPPSVTVAPDPSSSSTPAASPQTAGSSAPGPVASAPHRAGQIGGALPLPAASAKKGAQVGGRAPGQTLSLPDRPNF
jgi:serine/threonine-protein kinase